jgi:uncharacterized membrane protein
MTRAEFLDRLEQGLRQLPEAERARILADYDSYFADGEAAGRAAGEISSSLGNPATLAAELRLAHEVTSWRADSRPRATLRLFWALLSLAALHSVAWLPFALGVVLIVAMFGAGLCALAYGIFTLVVEPFDAPLGGVPAALARALGWLSAGVGVLAVSGASAYALANAFVNLQQLNRRIARSSIGVST